MLPDAETYPLDAEDYTVHTEPVGPNMMRDTLTDELTFFSVSAAVLLLVFAVGFLVATGAKRLNLWRLLSLLILLASFTPAVPHFQYARDYLLGNMTNEPEATMRRIDRAVEVFTTTTLWGAPVVLLAGAFLSWRLPWTVGVLPLGVSASYWLFSYSRLDRMLYGTYVTIDGVAHAAFFAETLLLGVLALGWLWGRSPRNLLLAKLRV